MTLNDRNRRDSDWGDGDDLPFEPAPIKRRRRDEIAGDKASKLRRRLFDIGVIGIPSIIAAIYLYIFASPVFETDAVLSLRNSNASASGFGGTLSFLQGVSNMGRATDESFAVVANVRSREALIELDNALGLRQHYQSDWINYFQRLSTSATFEDFYSYYGGYVTVIYDEVTGQIILRTRAFDRELAYRMAEVIIKRSETLVNQFNQRARSDLMQVSNKDVVDTEERLRRADAALTDFRVKHGIMDPLVASQAIGGIINGLMSEAAKLQSEITAEIQLSSGRVTPQLEALRNKLKAVQSQIVAEQARLTGNADGLAQLLAPYQALLTDQEIARQAYIAALASLQANISEAKRQQLYLINIVAPTIEEQARLPKQMQNILLTFIASIGAWIVLKLLSAALRDHV